MLFTLNWHMATHYKLIRLGDHRAAVIATIASIKVSERLKWYYFLSALMFILQYDIVEKIYSKVQKCYIIRVHIELFAVNL